MGCVNVCEVFSSIQGESSYAGLPCFFIRLAGCNLRCAYCDTPHAWEPGRDVAVPELIRQAARSPAAMVEVTGGEPLLQPGFVELAVGLRDGSGKPVVVETNGSLDVSMVPDGVAAVVDVKCPGSGESGAFAVGNTGRLRPIDEIKFVLSDRADYDWAKAFIERHGKASACRAVWFTPAFGRLPAEQIAEWIVADGLAVRLQVPLHKIFGVR